MPKLYEHLDTNRPSGCAATNEFDINRSAFQKDYARLLHAPSFRRLQGKTQLFPGADSDFFRNRLTHSLEVSQIANGVASFLNAKYNLEIDNTLVQFAAIAHDLGHPPFGHNGEHALEELMRKFGGFEGNAQTLRILTSVEAKLVKTQSGLSSRFGLDLTYRTLASILKYDEEIPLEKSKGQKLAKGFYHTERDIVAEIKNKVAPGHTGRFKTIECGIMDLADDIAYSTYDLEDTLHAGFVTLLSLLAGLFSNKAVFDEVLLKTNKALADNGHAELEPNELQIKAATYFRPPLDATTHQSQENKILDEAVLAMEIYEQDQQISKNCLPRTLFTAERVGRLIREVEFIPNEEFPALAKVRLSREALIEVEIYKHLNFELVIRSPKLAVIQHRGKEIVTRIFEALLHSQVEGDLLSQVWKEKLASAKDKPSKARIVCDFVAGMTDRYAVEVYDALFGDGKGLYGPI